MLYVGTENGRVVNMVDTSIPTPEGYECQKAGPEVHEFDMTVDEFEGWARSLAGVSEGEGYVAYIHSGELSAEPLPVNTRPGTDNVTFDDLRRILGE